MAALEGVGVVQDLGSVVSRVREPVVEEVERQSPASIRSEVFSHRMRGLDEEEVRDFLDLVADQVQATDAELARQRREIESLRAENHALRAESQALHKESQALRSEHQSLRSENRALRSENIRVRDEASRAAETSPRAVSILRQAQLVSDQLVEDAVVRARDLIRSAHSQRREILRKAREEAELAARSGVVPPSRWNSEENAPRTYQREWTIQRRQPK